MTDPILLLAILLMIADVAVIFWAAKRRRLDAVGAALIVVGALLTWLVP